MKSLNYYLITLLLLNIFFVSCESKDVEGVKRTYENGVLILNEGPFIGGAATLDFYDNVKDSLYKNVYSEANNGEVIGSILQSVTVIDDNAYLVVNNSAKIEVVDAKTLVRKETITGLDLPRYIVDIGNGSALVSEWGADGVSGQLKVIDLNSLTVVDSVKIGISGPEQIVVANSKIYVANSGGYDVSNTVSIYDLDLSLLAELTVGTRAINLAKKSNDDVMVLSGGSFGSLEGASICEISDLELQTCTDLEKICSNLISNASGTMHYFVEDNKVRVIDTENSIYTLPIDIDEEEIIYGLGFDDRSQTLYMSTTVDFSSQSKTYIIAFDGSISNITTGILTNGFLFL